MRRATLTRALWGTTVLLVVLFCYQRPDLIVKAASGWSAGSGANTLVTTDKVGIGFETTSSPSYALHVYKNTNGVDLEARIENAYMGNSSYFTVMANSAWAGMLINSSDSNWGVGRFGGYQEFMIKDLNNNRQSFVIQRGAPNNSIYVTSTGQIGLGTYLTANTLDVMGSMSLGTYAGNGSNVGATAAAANGLIVSGNVGIGTSAPAERLDVTGNIHATGNVTANGTIYAVYSQDI